MTNKFAIIVSASEWHTTREYALAAAKKLILNEDISIGKVYVVELLNVVSRDVQVEEV